MIKNKNRKLLFLISYLILALVFVLVTKPLYIVSIIIVLLVPSTINFLWLKNSRWPVFLFSFLSALLFAPPVELMARLVNVWDVQSIFYRPFGLIPLENMLFAFLNFFWGLSFYKYFIDNDSFTTINKRFKYLIGLYLGNSSVANSYGAAGSVIALLLWVYYTAQIFFLGAVFTKQYALCFGSLNTSDKMKAAQRNAKTAIPTTVI